MLILQRMYCLVSHKSLRSLFIPNSRNNKVLNFKEIISMRTDSMPLLYHSLMTILDVLEKPENKNTDGVKELLDIYEKVKDENSKYKAAGEVKTHPLIVLEGLDGSGKTTVGNRFAKKIGAKKWKTPPESISHIRHLFDDNNNLRTAYYSLGNYIAALEVEMLLKNCPVVMDRFWHSTAAYAIAQSIQDKGDMYVLPAKGDKIYCWPEDLFKPDIVLLLNVSEEVRLQRQSRRTNVTTQEELLNSCSEFRKQVIEAYQNMYNPGVILINGDLSFGAVLGQLQKETSSLLKK
nr:UMP-CMP kinase 2, mitochondrial-like [Leptinotarsa decemlineata]